MCQVSSGELGLVDPLADASVDMIEGALERGVDGAEIGKCGGQARAQDAVIDAGEEQRSPESELGDAVAEAFGQAFDQAVESQATALVVIENRPFSMSLIRVVLLAQYASRRSKILTISGRLVNCIATKPRNISRR